MLAVLAVTRMLQGTVAFQSRGGPGQAGERARAKRPENLKDEIRTPAENAPIPGREAGGATGGWQGAAEGRGRVNARAERAPGGGRGALSL